MKKTILITAVLMLAAGTLFAQDVQKPKKRINRQVNSESSQIHQRLRYRDCDGDGIQDGTGDMIRNRSRNGGGNGLRDGSGSGQGLRQKINRGRGLAGTCSFDRQKSGTKRGNGGRGR